VRAIPWTRAAVVFLSLMLGIEGVALVRELLRSLPAVTVPTTNPEHLLPRQEAKAALPQPLDAVPDAPSIAATASAGLFKPAQPVESAASGAGINPSPSAKQLAARLTLKGIVSGNPPQAIIEDAETKKTYFVSVGQAVVEGALLEQVLDNRVILNLNGEKIDLAL